MQQSLSIYYEKSFFLWLSRSTSLVLIVGITGILSSCSSQKVLPSESAFQRAHIELNSLVEHHGKLETPLSRDYLKYLASRLALNSKSTGIFNITLLRSAEPLAYSPGGRQLVLSRGMVSATRSEAELAFVIAHEMSHELLGHLAQVDRHLPSGSQSSDRKALEIEADRHALQLLTLAGYDPRASAHGLFNVYEAARLSRSNTTHPEVEERVRIMLHDVLLSRWRPPGTIDRREFQIFRREAITH
jgi:predicted Zn-dependent protease